MKIRRHFLMDRSTRHPNRQAVHPRAKDLMNEPFYFDEVDGTGPFGNDDGADAYKEFITWRQENRSVSPKVFLTRLLHEWDYPLFDFTIRSYHSLVPYLKESEMHIYYQLGIDQVILAVAFGQLYLEGEMDPQLLELAGAALDRQNDPAMLATWGEEYRDIRRMKLSKMAGVLNSLEATTSGDPHAEN